jgi:hypothetical protein
MTLPLRFVLFRAKASLDSRQVASSAGYLNDSTDLDPKAESEQQIMIQFGTVSYV